MQWARRIAAGLLITCVVILLYATRSAYVSTTMRVTVYNTSDVNEDTKTRKYQEEKPGDSRLDPGQGEITHYTKAGF